MANSESTVVLLRSKHRVFSNTLKRISQSIGAHFVIAKKSLRDLYVIIIKVNFIDRIHTKEL